jgi:hypothetical protein
MKNLRKKENTKDERKEEIMQMIMRSVDQNGRVPRSVIYNLKTQQDLFKNTTEMSKDLDKSQNSIAIKHEDKTPSFY